MIRKSVILSLMLVAVSSLAAQTVELTIKGIRSEKGQIAVGIFRDDQTFQKEEPFMNRQFPKRNISNGEMRVELTLEPGVYGLSLLDDENSNGKMEYNFLGIPKEGFGFSDYYHTGLTKPKFKAFSFMLEPGQKKVITIRIRYM